MGRLTGRSLSRLAWVLCGAALVLLLVSLVLIILGWSTPLPRGWTPWRDQAVSLAGIVGAPVLGGLIASRRPRNPYGWLWLGFGSGLALQLLAESYAAYALVVEPGSLAAPRTISRLLESGGPLALCIAPFLLLLFPDGQLPSPRWRPLAWISTTAGAMLLTLVLLFGSPDRVGGAITITAIVVVSVIFASIALSALSLVFRYRRASGLERQQLKWVAFAAVLVGIFTLGQLFLLDLLLGESWQNLLNAATNTTLYVAVGIAILRYRLYDIDLIINRALVYGALTASIVGIYILVVGYLGASFRTEDDLFVSLVATGLVAVLFQPLRERLQRVVDRLMYGERDDPYAAISRLGERLEAALEPEAVLPTIVLTVREALRLPYAAVTLGTENDAAVTESGTPVDEPLRLPLLYRGEPVGELLLAPRSGEEDFSPADRRLLEGLARQAGIAAHAVRLTNDLRSSRERLVTAREEERRRLRRDLHDGLGPTLGSLPLKLDVADDLVVEDPAAARELLRGLKTQAQSAVVDIRRLVYDLRPPALDDLGLLGALRELAAQHNADGLQRHRRVAGRTSPAVRGRRGRLPPYRPGGAHQRCPPLRRERVRRPPGRRPEGAAARGIGRRPRPRCRKRVGRGPPLDARAGRRAGRELRRGATSGRRHARARLAAPHPGLPGEAMTDRTRVLIADDHPFFRDGLRVLLESTPDTELVGEAKDAEEAISLAADLSPDVILMDLRMPGPGGIEATRRILAKDPEVGVLVITMVEEDDSVFAAMRAGALGYLLKGADKGETLAAIRAVARGEAVFGPGIARRLIRYFDPPPSAQRQAPSGAFPELTAREREILDLVAAGKNNAEIARTLFLSLKTIRNYVSNIFTKLQVADRAQAIVRAREAGMGGEPPG